MEMSTLCFVLLLPLCWCLNSEETRVKTVSKETDVTPLCTNTTESIISMIVCKIRTNNSREECRLMYQLGRGFLHECDSRFTLKTQNQTVFLHLNGLTPVDRGIYTCECIFHGGVSILHLNVTVEALDNEDVNTSSSITAALMGVTIIIIVSGAIAGFIYRARSNGIITSGSSVRETPVSLGEDDHDNPYESLQQTDNDVYQTIPAEQQRRSTKRNSAGSSFSRANVGHQEIDAGETDQNWEIYENV